MRFDDSLRTVFRFDSSSRLGARSTWRQLVDLAGRGRIATDEPMLMRLRKLRQAVPLDVRAATARALVQARPTARLIGFFSEDELAVSAPLLRNADLPAADWIALLPRLGPPLRSVLRRRRDLDPEVARALESFGRIDLALPRPERGGVEPLEPDPVMITVPGEPEPPVISRTAASRAGRAFSVLGEVARGLPMAAEALARAGLEVSPTIAGFEASRPAARIAAFRTDLNGTTAASEHAEAVAFEAADQFRFETDAAGLVIGVEGVARGALVGLSITHSGVQGLVQLDGAPGGAFRRRSRFADARLEVGGTSSAAGSWRLSAVPAFNHATGRFTGYRGVGRRPRVEEDAARPSAAAPSPDSLRLLVHELRTPANAIAGFAEMIETALLGPVADTYRVRAAAIRRRASDLLDAIEDLDTASRIEMGALELRPGPIALRPLVERVVADLAPLAAMRVVRVVVEAADDARALADDRTVERLLGRLFATLVAAGSTGETIRASIRAAPSTVEVAIDRPRAFLGLDADALLALDVEEGAEGGPLLGAGFALRVARNLAAELGGALELGATRLTLRLPAVVDRSVEHATTI